MAIELNAAWSELVAEVTGDAHEGEAKTLRAIHVVTAVAKLAGQVMDGLDSENQAVELPQLRAQAGEALSQIAAKLKLGRMGDWAMSVALPLIAPKLLELPAGYTAKIEAVRDDKIVPALTDGILIAAAIRRALAPDAPAVSV